MQIKAINRGALSALNERSLLAEARAYSSDFFTRSFAEGNFALDGGRHRLAHARVILEKLIKVWTKNFFAFFPKISLFAQELDRLGRDLFDNITDFLVCRWLKCEEPW